MFVMPLQGCLGGGVMTVENITLTLSYMLSFLGFPELKEDAEKYSYFKENFAIDPEESCGNQTPASRTARAQAM